jgi:hypothetical protein
MSNKEIMLSYLSEKLREIYLAKGEACKKGIWVEDGIKREMRDEIVDVGHGYKYYGEWCTNKKNTFHGRGMMIYDEGFMKEGMWKDDKMIGYGIEISFLNGFYEGEFKNGLRDGMGILQELNGSTYKGTFKEDYIHGVGKY